MIRKIISSSDSLENKITQLNEFLKSYEFLESIFYPDDFLESFIPFAVIVLNTFVPEKDLPYSHKNEHRMFILKTLNKFILKNTKNIELVRCLHDTLENDNLHNVVLTLKIFVSVNKSSIMTSELFDSHLSSITNLINSVFVNLEEKDEGLIEFSFFTLVQIFSYIADILQRQNHPEKRIETIIFRTVNFYRVFLDNRNALDLINYKKNISLELISSISKLIKIVSESKIFLLRNESFNSMIMELAKFAVYYCPIDATDLRKEMFFYIFKILLKNREFFVPKIEEFFDFRFFYSSESHLTNIKGLIGLTDIALVFSDLLTKRVPYELILRTKEILQSSVYAIYEKLENNCEESLLNGSNLGEKYSINFLEDERCHVYERSLRFHLEIVLECMNSMSKQFLFVSKQHLQKIELLEYCHRQFKMIFKAIILIDRVNEATDNIEIKRITKSIFLSAGRPLKEISEKLTEIIKTSTEFNIFTVFKADKFYSLFEVSLRVAQRLEFEEKEIVHLEDFYSIFFIPIDLLFIDITKRFFYDLFIGTTKNRIIFEVIKKLLCCDENGNLFVAQCIEFLVKILSYDIKKLKNEKDEGVQDIVILSENEIVFCDKYFEERKANNFEFYDTYFSIICNYCNLNFGQLTKKNSLNLFLSLNSLLISENINFHRILLSCFEILNTVKDKVNFFQMYFYKIFERYVDICHKLYLSTCDSLYLELIFAMPVNFNLVISQWCCLFTPIYSALRVEGDITSKALGVFLYIIVNSKKETFDEKYELELQMIFHEVFNFLNNPKFSIICSQIIGKIKSYHRKYLCKEIFHNDYRFFFKGMSHIILNEENIAFDDVIIEAIKFLTGNCIYEERNRVIKPHKIFKFKSRISYDKKDEDLILRAFNIITDFAYLTIGWEKYKEDDIVHKISVLIENMYMVDRSIVTFSGKADFDLYIAKQFNIPFSDQTMKTQYMYDLILSLFHCEGYKVEKRATRLLELIFQVVATYWFLELFYFTNLSTRTIFNFRIFYKALFESFGSKEKKMPKYILRFFLDLYLDIASNVSIMSECRVLDELFLYLIELICSSNEKKIIAGKNALCCFLGWNNFPLQFISGNIDNIFSSFYLYIKKVGRDWKDCLEVTKKLLSILVTKLSISIYNNIVSIFLNGLMSNDRNTRIFSKDCLMILVEYIGFKYSDVHKAPIFMFFQDLNLQKGYDVFARKLDVFIFITKKFNLFFSKKELRVLLKLYFYYLSSVNFFERFSPSLYIFETDISKIYSESFKEQELRFLNSSDILFLIYYKLETDSLQSVLNKESEINVDIMINKEERYNKYLMYEIIYMFIAISNQKHLTKAAFDLVFNNLPLGLVVPLKKLYQVNSSLVREHLLEKYEECFVESLSINTIKKMIVIFSVIEIHDDSRLVELLSQVFMNFRDQREILIFSENEENSILVKTFELSLMFPNQTELYDKIILIVYTLFYQFSKTYVSKIDKIMLEYIERHSQLVFPFIVKNITEDSVYYLAKNAFEASIPFKNFVNNLNSSYIDEVIFSIRTSDFNNILDIQRTINLFDFLRLINYDIGIPHVQLCLMVFRELKKKNKRIESIKKFIKFAINKFTPQDFEMLFSIDPLFKINNSCSVKTFKSITSKTLMTCLLKSINKKDTQSFENLIRFFGDQSWMLIDLFVEVDFFSKNMLEYCKSNLHNINTRSHLLFYLCYYEPEIQYFDMLFNLSYEERKYTLFCLKKVAQKFNPNLFEETILKFLNSEIRYKTNIHILYPLLISVPSLMTEKIAKELIITVHRLLNTFVHFHQKIGANIFNLIYDFYYNLAFPGQRSLTWIEKYEVFKKLYCFNILSSLYTLLFINFIHSKKSLILDYFTKYLLLLDLDSVTFYSDLINVDNIILFLEQEIELGKPSEYIGSLIKLLYKTISQEWIKFQVSENLMKLFKKYKLINIGNLVVKPINRDLNKITFLNMLLTLIESNFNDLNNDLVYNSILETFSDFVYYDDNEDLILLKLKNVVEMTIKKIFKEDNPHEEFVKFYTKLLKLDLSTHIDWECAILDVLLNKKISVNESISILLLIYSQIKEGNEILDMGTLLNASLYFFSNNKYLKLNTLRKTSEIFFSGLTYSDTIIRKKYLQILSDSLPLSFECRFMSLLDLDYEFVDQKYIPFIINTMIFESFENVTLDSTVLYVLGYYKIPNGFLNKEQGSRIKYTKKMVDNFKISHVNPFLAKANKFSPSNFRSNLLEFLYYSNKGNLDLLGRVINLCMMNLNNDDYSKVVSKLIYMIDTYNFNDDLSYVILKSIDLDKVKLSDHDVKIFSKGRNSWTYLLDYIDEKNKIEIYKNMRNRDYYYGFMRSKAKFPEVMQALTYQQFEKFREAEELYEKIQEDAVASKISYDEDEYNTLLNEWVECARELQQWDICYSLGKYKGDSTLSTDSMFYTSNFNISSERDNFANILNLMEPGIKKSVYELFISLYTKTSTDKIVALVKKVLEKISEGPRLKDYNNYYLLMLQMVFEMHESSFLFNNNVDNQDKVSALLYRWEFREPKFEDYYSNLSFFNTWRKHVYRKITYFSNEAVYNESVSSRNLSSPIGKYSQLGSVQIPKSIGDLSNIKQEQLEPTKKFNLSGIVSKNKEFNENLTKFKKDMFSCGNNNLGKNINFLALAAFKKGLYDNALFLFKDLFELPSIKVIDAYHKVIYELMSFFEMKEYSLGFNLSNSTNIAHFSNEQGSNLFRIRGMFAEKINKIDEAEKLFLQSIQISSLSENFLCYVRLLIKKYKILDRKLANEVIELENSGNLVKDSENAFKINVKVPEDIKDEVLSAILQGICCSNNESSNELIVLLLLILKLTRLNFDEFMFKSIISNCNPSSFVIFIPKIVKLLSSDNYNYAVIILSHIVVTYPQPIALELNMMINTLKNKKNEDVATYKRIIKFMRELPNQEVVKSIISDVFAFKMFSKSVGLQIEQEIFMRLDTLIENTISFIYDSKLVEWFVNVNQMAKLLETSCICREQLLLTIYNLLQSEVLCPFKTLEIFIHIAENSRVLFEAINIDSRKSNDNLIDSSIMNRAYKTCIYGSYNRIRKDYRNMVCVEFYSIIPSHNLQVNYKADYVYFVGSDGKNYKYECNTLRDFQDQNFDLSHFAQFLVHKTRKNFKLRSREASLKCLLSQRIFDDMYVNVIENSSYEIDCIYQNFKIKKNREHVYLKYLESVDEILGYPFYEHDHDPKTDSARSLSDFIVNYFDEIMLRQKLSSLEIDIIGKFKEIKDSDAFKVCNFKPKLSNKAKLGAFIRVLDESIETTLLEDFLKKKYDDTYSYFSFKDKMLKTFCTDTILSYSMHTINRNPKNILIYSDKGYYINRAHHVSEVFNEMTKNSFSMFLSPNIQNLFKLDGIEGPFTSVLYFGFRMLDEGEWFEDLIRLYYEYSDIQDLKYEDLIQNIRLRIKEVLKEENNDFNILKVINGWTDINNMSRIRISEYPWI